MMRLSFFIFGLFIVAGIVVFIRGLIKMYRQDNEHARGWMSVGFVLTVVGVLVSAIVFDIFSM